MNNSTRSLFGVSLIVKIPLLKIGLAPLLAALSLGSGAQTYNVATDASMSSQAKSAPAQTPSTKSTDRSLGWGSNIQNARLARAAQLALQHGDNSLALDYAQRAAKATPNDPQLWFLVGYAARLSGKYPASVDAYNRGLLLSPATADGLSGLAQTYNSMGRPQDAVRLLKQVLASDPKRRDDVLLLADLRMRAEDYTAALESLSVAERLQASARSELLMALCYQRLNQTELAGRYLEMAEQRAPDNPEVQRTMAGYYRESRHYARAIAALRSIRNPKPDVIAELAFTYQLDGSLIDSARLYEQAANAEPQDMSMQLSAAQAEVAVGALDKANALLQRAAKLDPNHYRLHAIRGELARIQERDQDAAREYGAAIASLPEAPSEGPLYGIQLHMDRMAAYDNLGDGPASRKQLEQALAKVNALGEPTRGKEQFLRLRARIRLNTSDLSGALADIEEALRLNAHNRDFLQLKGDILMKQGRPEDAITAYDDILASEPANRFALTSLGYAERSAGRDHDAEMYFLRLARVSPSLYVPHLALGDLYTARRDFAGAEDSYSKAYTLAPRRSSIVAGGMNAAIEAHNLGLAGTWMSRVTKEMEQAPQILRERERYLRFKGDYAASAQIGKEAIKVLPQDRDVVVYLGYDLLFLQQYSDLLTLTSEYLDRFPKEPNIPLLAGYVHKHQGLADQARQDFTEALKRDPEVVTAYVNRGYMMNDLHEASAAAEDFEAALKREPDNGEAHLGLAYADLNLLKLQAALREAGLAERALGDSRDIHIIRATAYGREDEPAKAETEYRAALLFTPNDPVLHLGVGNALFSQRQYSAAIDELQIAAQESAEDAQVYALLARCYAKMQDKDQTLRYLQQAERTVESTTASSGRKGRGRSDLYVSTGEALSDLGDREGAMKRFREALLMENSDRVGIRLAIARVMVQQGHSGDAERQIALAQMEGVSGETQPPTASQLIAAADVFRSIHDYQLSQSFLRHASDAGARPAEVRVGLANNYLAMGDTASAQAELVEVSASADGGSSYQYLLAEANVLRQQHNETQALTSLARASLAGGEDPIAELALLQVGADEGLRLTPKVSVLFDSSVDSLFEDSTVYVLDSKLDSAIPVPPTDTAHLPPPRSSIETQLTTAYHLHAAHIPTTSGFFQVRNAQGQISVPSTRSIVTRNSTDYIANIGLTPSVALGHSLLTFDSGIQATVRRDADSPKAMNQNLFRVFSYVSTSSLFNVISASGSFILETGPFTESNLHSRAVTTALDFRVGSPWGKTALVTGWGLDDEKTSPGHYENHFTSSYIGMQRRFGERINIKAVVEDIRAWRAMGTHSGIAQNLRPAGSFDFTPNRNWSLQFSTAYSSTRSFHAYDAIQNRLSVSYTRPFHRNFHDDTGEFALQYPIRFSAGFQQETFLQFQSSKSSQFRPYVRISLF